MEALWLQMTTVRCLNAQRYHNRSGPLARHFDAAMHHCQGFALSLQKEGQQAGPAKAGK
jgi:hypothetical protein